MEVVVLDTQGAVSFRRPLLICISFLDNPTPLLSSPTSPHPLFPPHLWSLECEHHERRRRVLRVYDSAKEKAKRTRRRGRGLFSFTQDRATPPPPPPSLSLPPPSPHLFISFSSDYFLGADSSGPVSLERRGVGGGRGEGGEAGGVKWPVQTREGKFLGRTVDNGIVDEGHLSGISREVYTRTPGSAGQPVTQSVRGTGWG